jgi:hypothetical protein
MNSHDNPSGPLLQALVDDQDAISLATAADVRARMQRRRKAQRGSIFAAVLLAIIASLLWALPKRPDHNQASSNGVSSGPQNAAGIQGAFVKEYPMDSSSRDDDLNAIAATEEERELLIDLRAEPALIVWNDSGQISYVQTFERSE